LQVIPSVRRAMFERILNLFARRQPERTTVVDPQLGELRFSPDHSTWETLKADVYHGGIPGTEAGPSAEGVNLVRERMSRLDDYWAACEPDLRSIAESFESIPKGEDIRSLYRVAALSLYSDYWEVCFETHRQFKWLYVGMQFKGDELVSNTIDT